MESKAIANEQISASSQWDHNEAAHNGRLHFKQSGYKAGAWVALTNDENQWLQIELINPYVKITRVATQGRNGQTTLNWVTSYNLTYSNDGVKFHIYKERGHVEAKVWYLSKLIFINNPSLLNGISKKNTL